MILELRSFYALCIVAALIYSCKGGILASFLSSTVAIYLYPPVILQRQAIWTFWTGSYIVEFSMPAYPGLYPSFLVAFPFLGLRA